MWGLVHLVIILGGILGGVFTAIEAGAVACVYAFFVTMFVYRDYKWRDLPLLVHRTMKTVAMVMTLIAFAAAVGYMMALMQVPAKITARSEEHTSELQSHSDLVCRLLLEKKTKHASAPTLSP